jgi:hypothetical protein
MDDMPGGETIAAGQLRLAGRTAAEHATFGQQLGAGGAMDRAVDTAATEQRRIGRVDNGVDLKPGDIAGFQADPQMHARFYEAKRKREPVSDRFPFAVVRAARGGSLAR